jgi:coproporphyrinogen III oxidase-like Fe-S oxidoreductase
MIHSDYDEYVGVGSGSFGYVNGACFANTFSVPHYRAVKKASGPFWRKISQKRQALYDFMMKLLGLPLTSKGK